MDNLLVKFSELNEKYNQIINASYFNKLLTSTAQKNNECNNLIEEYKKLLEDVKLLKENEEVLKEDKEDDDENKEQEVKQDENKNEQKEHNKTSLLREIYIHLINLYSEISNSQEIISTKSKLYSLFSEEEFKEHLKNKSENDIKELLKCSEISEKDKYYIYLIEDRKLNKYIEEYVNSECENVKEDYVKMIFEKYLGTPEAKKYGEILIKKYNNKDYVLETDPLISNLDKYNEL